MDKLKYIKLENEDGSYSDSIPLAVDGQYVDINGISLPAKLSTLATKAEVEAVASGSPAGVYTTVSALTTADPDHDKIYIVTANGHWYYYNDGWQDGGAYQAAENSDTLDDLIDNYTDYKEETVNISFNRFNKDAETTLTSYYYGGDVGETLTKTANSTFYCGIIPVQPKEVITISSSGYKVLFMDSNNTIMSINQHTATSAQYPFTFTVPNINGITYAAINWKKSGTSAVSLEDYMAVKGDSLPSTYVPYGYIFNDEYIEKLKTKIELDVLTEDYTIYKEKTTQISPNIFNEKTAMKGKYTNDTSVGEELTFSSNSTYTTYCIENVSKGDVFTVTAVSWRYIETDDNNVVLRRLGNAQLDESPFTITIGNSNTTKLYITWKNTKYPDTTYMIVKGNSLPETYIPYGYNFNDDYATSLKNKLDSNIEFFVGYGINDNYRYFTSLVDCLYKAQEIEGFKTVHIKNGTYDVLEELGGMEYINSKNTTDDTWEAVQPVITNTKIIGHGNVILNFNLETTAQEHYWLFSALNIRGNCEIENIEIHSSRCRYSIHDESGDNYPNTYRKYKNVRCYNSSSAQACGCGYSQNTNVYIDNCIFDANSQSDGYSCHANNGVKLVINDSIFRSNGTSDLRISQNGGIGATGRIYAEISNCFLPHGLSVRNEYKHDVIDRTEVNLINTRVQTLSHQYENIGMPVTSYNTLTGEKTILLDVTE